MAQYAPLRVISQPGVKRDGTRLEGPYHVDAQWCRWHRGLPRKMKGWRTIDNSLTEKVYGLHGFMSGGNAYFHAGSKSKLYQRVTNPGNVLIGSSDRTPGAGFTADYRNNWQFGTFYDSVSTTTRLIAHAAPNLLDITDTTTTKVWYGDMTGTGALTDTGATQVSGGVSVIHPYLFIFGNDGWLTWSAPNKPTDFTTASGGGGTNGARVAGMKIVCGKPLRGTGSGPSGLFWSLDSLVRATYVGGSAIFAFDTVSEDLSILSSRSVIEYDGVYYWIGMGRFMLFNGVVRELPNQMNLDWFFDNLNYAYRQKVFAIKFPRWGEIWWCYPRGTATECTHAVIYNVRENTWYDTQLPDSGRSSGLYAKVYESPVMTGVDVLTGGTTYRLIKHDDGTNAIDGSEVAAVRSYYETNEFTLLEGQQPSTKSLSLSFMEPDFEQTGPMIITARGRPNARATEADLQTVEIPQTPPSPGDQLPGFKTMARLMSFRFESNVVDGNYVTGQCYAHIAPIDGRVEG